MCIRVVTLRVSCCSSTSDNEVCDEAREIIEILALRARKIRTAQQTSRDRPCLCKSSQYTKIRIKAFPIRFNKFNGGLRTHDLRQKILKWSLSSFFVGSLLIIIVVNRIERDLRFVLQTSHFIFQHTAQEFCDLLSNALLGTDTECLQ